MRPRSSGTGAHTQYAVDQTLTATPDIAVNNSRLALLIQNVGTSTVAVMLTQANQTQAPILVGGSAANDGLGGSIEITNYTGGVWLYALSAATGTVNAIEVTA